MQKLNVYSPGGSASKPPEPVPEPAPESHRQPLPKLFRNLSELLRNLLWDMLRCAAKFILYDRTLPSFAVRKYGENLVVDSLLISSSQLGKSTCLCETLGVTGNLLMFLQEHAASMTHRVQRIYGHGWEGKADHLPVPAVCECSNPSGCCRMIQVCRCAFVVAFVAVLELVESWDFRTLER